MPLLSPSGKQFSLHKLMAMSTMMSPPGHGRLVLHSHGGDATTPDELTHHLYLSHAFQDHLERVYARLCDGSSTLSEERFISWLESEQGQTIKTPQKESYTFQEFLEVVYFNHGFEIERPVSQDKDLSKPISNYFISSSHNTYLSGNQLSSKSSTDAYKNVLIRGCRCIEIDVYNGDSADSVTNSPGIASSPKPEHKRHISVTALSNLAAETAEKIEAKYKHTLSSLAAETAEKIEAKYKHTKEALKKKEGLGINIFSGNDTFSESVVVVESTESPASIKSTRNNGEPLVLHGWTLTTPIGFRDVCKTVRETAFLTTNLPIIVSLEVHANLEQQEVMVNIMKEEWKGFLIDAAHPTCDPAERVPRLDELLNKILVKVKKAPPRIPEVPSEGLAPHHAHRASTASMVPSHSPRASISSLLSHSPKASSTSLATSHSPRGSSSSLSHFSRHLSISSNTLAPVISRHDGDSHSGSEDERTSKKKFRICDNLSNLGIYTHSEHFVAFGEQNCTKPSHIFSISENQIIELHEKKKEEMFAHNRDFFMRAYPAGFRFDSSNLDPSLFWRKGVQMVALNWQNVDEGVMLNEAMFGGEQGWVLKPPGYRSGTETTHCKTLHLRLTIYAGQHIPIPQNQTESGFRPYVRCQLHVEKPDESKSTEVVEGNGRAKGGEYKQRTPQGKGDHPDFGEEGAVIDFPVVKGVVEELSFVRFKIEDEKYAIDSLAAWACIRLDRLQHGYRFLRLVDTKGVATEGMFLVRVEKTIS